MYLFATYIIDIFQLIAVMCKIMIVMCTVKERYRKLRKCKTWKYFVNWKVKKKFHKKVIFEKRS